MTPAQALCPGRPLADFGGAFQLLSAGEAMILLLLDCPLGERCVNSQVSVLVSVRPLFNLMER